MPSTKIMSLVIGRTAGKNAGLPPENLGKSGSKRPASTTKKRALQKLEDSKSEKTK